MKHFAVALVVAVILAFDFAADAHMIDMAASAHRGWDWTATFAVVYAGWFFWTK